MHRNRSAEMVAQLAADQATVVRTARASRRRGSQRRTDALGEGMPAPAARGSAARAAIVLVPLLNLLGGASAKVSGQTGDSAWFQSLVLPAAQPPGIVFPIAWTVLYTLMAIAAALVWGTRIRGRRVALGLFMAQLALNLAWAPLFFREHQLLYSLVLLGVIWVAALVTTFAFGRVNRVAAWLLVPYMVWLSFAAALNFDIWRYNSVTQEG